MITVHPDRFNYTATILKGGAVVHCSESPDESLAGLLAACQRPGDHHEPDGSIWGSSYHAITDGTGGYVTILNANQGPFAVPPLNNTWWHVCMPGYVAQTREQWLDAVSRQHIRGVAQFIIDKQAADGGTWPAHYIDVAGLKAGYHGYTSHHDVSLAFKQSTHTDPFPNFPWDVLAADVTALTATRDLPPAPSGDAPTMFRVFTTGDANGLGEWLLTSAGLTHTSGPVSIMFAAANVASLFADKEQMRGLFGQFGQSVPAEFA